MGIDSIEAGYDVGATVSNPPMGILYQQALHWDPQLAQAAIDDLARMAANGDVEAQTCLNDVLDVLYQRQAESVPNAEGLIQNANTSVKNNIVGNADITNPSLYQLSLSACPTVARAAIEELVARSAQGDVGAQRALSDVISELETRAGNYNGIASQHLLYIQSPLLQQLTANQVAVLESSEYQNLASRAQAELRFRAQLGGA